MSLRLKSREKPSPHKTHILRLNWCRFSRRFDCFASNFDSNSSLSRSGVGESSPAVFSAFEISRSSSCFFFAAAETFLPLDFDEFSDFWISNCFWVSARSSSICLKRKRENKNNWKWILRCKTFCFNNYPSSIRGRKTNVQSFEGVNVSGLNIFIQSKPISSKQTFPPLLAL